ncbi:hypothetical protein BS47DRAFT_1365872 [Hydnum rufescens UP504]|uniref:Uncharacterized protein n=1 Tax=Hydnum rufescens UP504 TaxID=1448309 RepID=A0A9P6ANJ7_9AGAM|nr:hypothetical protein BS47DRAFT_1365872 [Hydnum rufescens UP504]
MYCTTHPLQRAAGQWVFILWGFGWWEKNLPDTTTHPPLQDLSAFWVPAIASIESRSFFATPHPLNTTTQKGKQGKHPRMEADNHTPAAAGVWSSKIMTWSMVTICQAMRPPNGKAQPGMQQMPMCQMTMCQTTTCNAPNGNVPNNNAPNDNTTDTSVTDDKGPKEPHTHCSGCVVVFLRSLPFTRIWDLNLHKLQPQTPRPQPCDPKPTERSPVIPKLPNKGLQAKPLEQNCGTGFPQVCSFKASNTGMTPTVVDTVTQKELLWLLFLWYW